MIKKTGILLFAIIFAGIESCNISDQVVPDLNTILVKTFQIRILENSGATSDQMVDISSTNEYNNFKNMVTGYELTKITYKIKNDNVPDDMFFSGEIICKNEVGDNPINAGNISRVKISAAAAEKTEYDVIENMTEIYMVLGWLEDTGKFKLSSSFNLTNEQNLPYQINSSVSGSNFELIIYFYVKVRASL